MSDLRFQVLTDSEIHRIHEQTLKVFENVGIRIGHGQALGKLKHAGARVDEAAQLVRFPRELVEELLQQAPAVALYSGINGKTLEIGGDNRYYGSLVTDPWVTDYHDGRRRPKLEDIRRHTIIGQSLDRISAMMRMQFPVTDVPEPDCYYKTMEVFLSHLTKHVSIYPTSVGNCLEWMEVYERIADAAGIELRNTPLLSVAMAVTSPLQIHGPNIDIMKLAMERGFPVISTVCPMAGTTSPYSVAGTALVSNVEALAPVLVAQVYEPGHPVTYGFGPSVTDLRSGRDLYYKAEKTFFKTIACQLGKFYNLPISNEAGGALTFRPDVQNGAEGMVYLLASHCERQNILGGVGSMDNANGMSGEQIIMQCGLIDMAEYLSKGVDISDKKLAYESIKDVGPGGNFMTEDLTLELLRSDEFFHTDYFDLTGGYDPTKPGIYEKAHQTANELVENYTPEVPEKVIAAIKNFFKDKYHDSKVADM